MLTNCASNTSFSEENRKASNNDISANLLKIMEEYPDFTGTVLVAKDDEVLLSRGYGMADYDKQIANEPQKVFELGSLTKQFTAAAILMLQEKKLLSVQDTVNMYIPDYPNGDKIKIHNLLTHTSGISDYSQFYTSEQSGEHTYTTEELIGLFKNKPLVFDSGTRHQYCNSNYVLLEYIMEKVSGMKYQDYIEKNIFEPLEMNSSGFLSNQDNIKNKAIGYTLIDKGLNKYSKAQETEPLLACFAGGIYSTIEDLYKWSNALYTEELIKKESLNEMFTPYLDEYGYAWFINEDKVAYHSGNISGYTSFICRNINEKKVVIILSNKRRNAVSASIAFRIMGNLGK